MLVVESHDEGPRAGLAADGEGHGRPAGRRRSIGRPRHGDARAGLDGRARRSARARARVREHRRRRGLRRRAPTGSRRVGPSCGASSASAPTTWSSSRVARLAPEKGLDDLVRAVADGGRPAARARSRGRGAGARAPGASWRASTACGSLLAGDVEWERIVELYVAADVFALLSERETVGGRRERGGCVRAAARALGSGRGRARPPPRRRERGARRSR